MGNVPLQIGERALLFVHQVAGVFNEYPWRGHMVLEEIDGESYAWVQMPELWLRDDLPEAVKAAAGPHPTRRNASIVRFSVLERYLKEPSRNRFPEPGRLTDGEADNGRNEVLELNGMTDKNPDFSPIRMRARGFVSQGRIEDALGLYGDILKIAPEDAAAYADRGTTFAMIKKTDFALNDLNRAIELGYTDASAYCTLATIFLEGGGYQKSLDYFDKALTLNPDQPFVYFNRARAYETLGDIKAAIADLEKCLTYNPDDALSAKIKDRVAQLRARA